MSKKSNPTMIGAFVVSAIALLAIAASLFGGAELFAKRFHYVAYFEEQTKGLREGSNVVLNGVRIGYVSEIALLIDETEFDTMTRVTMEILPESFTPIRDRKLVTNDVRDVITHESLVNDAGLRAQLEVESFITGQLLIRLDLRPDTPIQMSGMDSKYPEIPTIRSNIQEMLARLQEWLADFRQKVDVEALASGATDALTGFANLMNSPDLQASLAGINTLINDEDTQELGTSLRHALDDVSDAAAEATVLFKNAEGGLDELGETALPVLAQLDSTLEAAEEALDSVQLQLRGDSQQAYQLQATLQEVETAATALREFFDYLERNPQALIRGKKQ